MKWGILIVLICTVLIGISITDLRCTALRPARDVVIVACRAGRLP